MSQSKSAKKPVKKTPKKSLRQTVQAVRDLDRPEYFINRELSWLEFNQRVLEEAQDATNPLLERLKFLSIVASNLDEFFEVRVAGLQQQAETRPNVAEEDGLTAQQTLDAIAIRVQRMVRDQYQCYNREIVPGLTAEGIDLLTINDLSEPGQQWAADYFRREVFPVLTPLAIDPAHPFPQLLNKSLNLAVALSIPDTPGAMNGLRYDEQHEATRFGVVQVPRALPRLVAVPAAIAPAQRKIYVFLSSIISEFIGDLFPGLCVEGCYAFRVTRNSELYLDEDEADNLLEAMQMQLQRRRRGDAVRLEVQRGCDPAVVEVLLRTFELEPIDLYEVDGPINLTRLMAVYGAENRPDLKDPTFTPAVPSELRQVESPDELFAAIRHADILVHHPYESFKSVIDFITMAADDPNVLAIKQTLYRTSGDSPIVRALMRAAQNGKQVTALVELKARFDEENNIQWARAMEQAGVHVLYGLVGLKTHSKLALVVRREGDEIHRYVHMGTGNYNEITARLYTDVGMLTARPDIGEDVAKVFNLLTGMSQFPGMEKLWVAPFGVQEEFLRLIERETTNAQRQAKGSSAKGKKSKPQAQIIAKMNALVDPGIIKALYRASQAGVQIDLIVRGVCCLRPGVPGVSENIRVRSIIDRFLEHSRLFYFYNNGADEIYCGSADWMPRNFFQRVEVIFPVENEALKVRLRDEVLGAALKDNIKARCIRPDGDYWRLRPGPKEAPFRCQQWLMTQARQHSLGQGDADLRSGRPAARPVPSAWGDGGQRATTLPKLELTLRPAPASGAPPATDGRAGTMADPVLQSLAGEVKHEADVSANFPDEMFNTTHNGVINAATNSSAKENEVESVDSRAVTSLKSAGRRPKVNTKPDNLKNNRQPSTKPAPKRRKHK
ncbi:MAG: polyphosphate kinase 1 [Abitibacteriaceae bacterium]|nr:polyphosphate kinase 1 [Abditibacteriaceae bacterium]